MVTHIRFSTTGLTNTNEAFWIDNVQFSFVATSTPTAQGANVVVDASVGMQVDSDVAMDSAGNFVITWTDAGAGYDIYARRYNAAGAPLAAAFLVNQNTAGIQVDSRVALSDNGVILFTWTGGNDNADGSYGIYTRRYNGATSSFFAVEAIVNTVTAGHQALAEVDVDANGDWVIVWNSLGQDGSDYGVYGRRITNVCGYSLTPLAGTLALAGAVESPSSSTLGGVGVSSGATEAGFDGLQSARAAALQQIDAARQSVATYYLLLDDDEDDELSLASLDRLLADLALLDDESEIAVDFTAPLPRGRLVLDEFEPLDVEMTDNSPDEPAPPSESKPTVDENTSEAKPPAEASSEGEATNPD